MRSFAWVLALSALVACADDTDTSGEGGASSMSAGGNGGSGGDTTTVSVGGGGDGGGTAGGGGAPDMFTVSGTIDGLKGTLVLLNNDGDDLTVTASDASFSFATAVPDGDTYDVTISSEPGTQRCNVTSGSGTIGGAAVTDVEVSCYDLVYFFAFTTAGVSRLHKTDGTMSGTQQEAFISADGDLRDAPYNGVTLDNGFAVFVADNGVDGAELFRTGDGTGLLVDIHPSGSSNPDQFVLLDGGHALFTATDPTNGQELWITDGTDTGTELVRDIRPGSIGSRINMSTSGALNGFVYFTADDGTNGLELWRSDGTEAGTTMVFDVTGDASSGAEESPTVAGGFVFFRGIDSAGTEPWVSDGTTTMRLADISAGGDSSPSGFVQAGGLIYFQANVSGDRQLWKTDGTPGGTALVANINGGGDDQVGNFVPFGSSLIFSANDGATGLEPWISDGTAGGTMRIVEVEAGGAASVRRFAAHGNVVTFVGDNGASGEEMWVTSGTAGTTSLIVDAYPGLTDGYQDDMALGVSGPFRFYWAETNGSGIEPWVTDGTSAGTFMLRDICPATCDSAVTN